MENFFPIFPHYGKNGGLRATFGPRPEAGLAFGNPCAKRALHTVENFSAVSGAQHHPAKFGDGIALIALRIEGGNRHPLLHKIQHALR